MTVIVIETWMAWAFIGLMTVNAITESVHVYLLRKNERLRRKLRGDVLEIER
jgi:hypothetical protein